MKYILSFIIGVLMIYSYAQQPQDNNYPVYAISVQYLDTVKWTKYYEPTAIIGGSIFIYDFNKTPVLMRS